MLDEAIEIYGVHESRALLAGRLYGRATTVGTGRDLGVGGGRTTVSIGAASEAACVSREIY